MLSCVTHGKRVLLYLHQRVRPLENDEENQVTAAAPRPALPYTDEASLMEEYPPGSSFSSSPFSASPTPEERLAWFSSIQPRSVSDKSSRARRVSLAQPKTLSCSVVDGAASISARPCGFWQEDNGKPNIQG